jgi:hypothetical protein
MNSLFCFGLGYTARALARSLQGKDWTVAGTRREAAAGAEFPTIAFDGQGEIAGDALEGVTHILVSVPPDLRGDPVLRCCSDEIIARARQFAWRG